MAKELAGAIFQILKATAHFCLTPILLQRTRNYSLQATNYFNLFYSKRVNDIFS